MFKEWLDLGYGHTMLGLCVCEGGGGVSVNIQHVSASVYIYADPYGNRRLGRNPLMEPRLSLCLHVNYHLVLG